VTLVKESILVTEMKAFHLEPWVKMREMFVVRHVFLYFEQKT